MKHARSTAVAAALAVLASATATVAAPAAPHALTPSSNVLQLWGLQSENTNSNYVPVGPAQSLLDAAHFTYLTAHPVAYAGEVSMMKAVNPRLHILAYENGVFAQAWQGNAFPANWYLYDANGNKVVNPKSGNYLMDPRNSGWIANRAALCQQLIAESGYDGCYLDMLGLASLRKGFVSAHPVDPYLNPPAPWPLNSWIDVTAALAAQVRAAVNGSGYLVMGNGLNSGALYYNRSTPTKALLDAMDGGIAEAWLRGSKISISTYHENTAWYQDVAMMAAGEAEGKPVLGLVKIGVPATAAQQQSWQEYSLATFLMGAGGLSALEFTPTNAASRTAWYSMYDVALGTPTSVAKKLASGVYQRRFANGLVLVDPTVSSLAVTLPRGTWYDTTGSALSGQITMAANTGLVLEQTRPPAVTISAGPPTPTTATTATLTFSSPTPGVTFDCALDGAAPAPCASPVTYTGLTGNQAHLVAVTATTAGGPTGPAAFYSWGIDDGAAPVIGVGTPYDNGSSSTDVFVPFTTSKLATSYSCSLDGGAAVPCSNPDEVVNLSPGSSHTLTVVGTDAYGVSSAPASVGWTVPAAAPGK